MDLFIKILMAIMTYLCIGAIIVIVITPIIYFVDIGAIWAVMPDLTADTITKYVPIGIAIGALFFSIWQGWEIRKNNRLSLRPLIGCTLFYDITYNKIHIKVNLVNHGVGPAIIKNAILYFDGEEFLRNSSKEFSDLISKHFSENENGFPVPDNVIKTGEEHILWDVEYKPRTDEEDFIKKLDLQIEYKSIYGDEMPPYDTRNDIQFKELKTPLPPSPTLSPIAEMLAGMHEECFTIPPPWSAELFAKSLKNTRTFHLIHKYGFVIGQRLDDTQTELLTLAVIPKQRGRGIGRALLTSFLAKAKTYGGESILLEVAENNASALHLYESFGFKKAGLRPAYYGVPDAPNIDAILMRFDIVEPHCQSLDKKLYEPKPPPKKAPKKAPPCKPSSLPKT